MEHLNIKAKTQCDYNLTIHHLQKTTVSAPHVLFFTVRVTPLSRGLLRIHTLTDTQHVKSFVYMQLLVLLMD